MSLAKRKPCPFQYMLMTEKGPAMAQAFSVYHLSIPLPHRSIVFC